MSTHTFYLNEIAKISKQQLGRPWTEDQHKQILYKLEELMREHHLLEEMLLEEICGEEE